VSTPLSDVRLDPTHPPRLALPDGEVHVWCLFTEGFDDPAVEQLGAILSPDEHARHARLLRERDRRLQRLARALLRVMLSAYAGTPPAAWRFGLSEHGKPYLIEPAVHPPIGFNVSHTDGLAAVAFARLDEVGVDVEYLDRRTATTDIAHRFFAPAEVARLDRSVADDRAETFFAFWTLKEAYLKARGVGLSMPLTSFAFDLDGTSPAIGFEPPDVDAPSRWHFERHTPGARHRLAVAASRPPGSRLEVRLGCVHPLQAVREPAR
jgi:4'-phosphopantetheinyl transferase